MCLSLLGTWNGKAAECWNPETSTLLQVNPQTLNFGPWDPYVHIFLLLPADEQSEASYLQCYSWLLMTIRGACDDARIDDPELCSPPLCMQVLVSIQGLVLTAEPYYNEAGYERQVLLPLCPPYLPRPALWSSQKEHPDRCFPWRLQITPGLMCPSVHPIQDVVALAHLSRLQTVQRATRLDRRQSDAVLQ